MAAIKVGTFHLLYNAIVIELESLKNKQSKIVCTYGMVCNVSM